MLQEILKIGRRKNQHFTSTIVAEVIVTLPRFEHAGPAFEIRKFALGLLREEVVCDPDRELAVLMKLFDHLIVFRIVLESTAGIDNAGDSEALYLAHKVAAAVHLIPTPHVRPSC